MGKNNIKKKNLDAPFVFFRFYSEALFLKVNVQRIDKYQVLFNDTLSSQEKYDLIAYTVMDGNTTYFSLGIKSFEINNVGDDRNYRAFSINFHVYNYFIILFNYDKGRMGCSSQYGEKNFIGLENSQKWYEEADLDIFCKELQEQLELRIPDKFLEANGWK